MKLTPRQAAVVALLAQGLKYRQIGARLGIAERTVRMHVEYVARGLPGPGPPLWRVVRHIDRLLGGKEAA